MIALHYPEQELHWWPATALTAAIARRELSAVEVLEAHLTRIAETNPTLNAIVTLSREGALAEALRADQAVAAGAPLGPLHGLPIAVKDLQDTAGMRTTYGSPIFADHIPDRDSPMVARLRAAGAIVIGKTNTAELGAGSQTFNAVFGATRNPYDRSLTAGGSSGGAAAAVASGMIPLADGTDLGGSIRNPSAFCNLVGLRPTPGLLPARELEAASWKGLSVPGPIGRTVDDLALFIAATAISRDTSPFVQGPSPSYPTATSPDLLAGVRVAWSADGGGLPVDPEIARVLANVREILEHAGCVVEEIDLDLTGADEAFQTLRAVRCADTMGQLLADHRDQLKDTIIWNIERGLSVSASELAWARTVRARSFARMRELLANHELLALPATQVLPFPVEEAWPGASVNGDPSSYLDWMRICSRITLTGHPALAIPGGFTSHGLPVGLQLVAGHGRDLTLLRHAAAFEALAPFGRLRPHHLTQPRGVTG